MSAGVDLAERRRRTQHDFYRLLDGVELDGGIWASLTPSAPDRSLFNAVTYAADPAPVIAAIPELAALYADAGVRAWTVWVMPQDRLLADALRDAGHRLDATPEAMGAFLADLDLEGPDAGADCSWEEVVEVNEAAYGVPMGGMAPLAGPLRSMRRYGVPGACVLGVHEVDGDAGVTFVATRPEARGRGLATTLMRQALRAARDRGCTTTTLEATKLGRPVYERLGYRSLGTLEMWERREAAG